MTRLITSRRLVLSIVALIVLNSILDLGVNDNARRLQTLDGHALLQTPEPSFGGHFVTLYVGAPAQPQRLMISLASEFTTFPCAGCMNCGDHHTGQFFDYSNSLVHTCPNDCAFQKSRCEDGTNQCLVVSSQVAEEDTEGGFRGFEVRDTAYLDTTGGRMIPTNHMGFIMDFVCQKQLRGMTQSTLGDGLLSLSMAPSSFISQLHARGKVSARKFALCFNEVGHYQDEGSSIGSVHFDEFDRSHHISTLVWALNTGRNTVGPENYAVRIKNVYLGIGGGSNPLVSASQGTMSIITVGKNLDYFVPPEEWLIDAAIQTNKPITQLPKNYEEAFHDAFLQLIGASYDPNGIAMTEKVLASMPTLFLQFEPHRRTQGHVPPDVPGFAGRLDEDNPYDIIFAVPAKKYFAYNHDTGIATPTIQFNDKISFLGANVLQGHELAFDLDNHRIGFVEVSGCEESLTLAGNPPTGHSDGDRQGNVGADEHETETGNSTAGDDNGNGYGIQFEVPTGDELEELNGGNEKGRGFRGDNSTNETIVVGGQGSQPEERPVGIPQAEGTRLFYAGPGAVAASEKLHMLNSHKAMSFDWFNVAGVLLLFASFGITVFGTRDKTTYRKDRKFKASDVPISYNDADLEKNAWSNSAWQPELAPVPELELEDATQLESEAYDSFRSMPSQQEDAAPDAAQRSRGLGLEMWSTSTKEFFKKKKGPVIRRGSTPSAYTEPSIIPYEPVLESTSQQSSASYVSLSSNLDPRPSFSQRTQPGVNHMDSASHTRDSVPTSPKQIDDEATAASESVSKPPKRFDDEYTTASESVSPKKQMYDEATAASEDYTHPETSSLPGMGATSSLPGMAAGYESVSYETGYETEEESAQIEPLYEVEEEVEEDYFPVSEHTPFDPSDETHTGYLVTRYQADDEQSILTMDEFPDFGSVSTGRSRSSRRASIESNMDTTRASEATKIQNNQSSRLE